MKQVYRRWTLALLGTLLMLLGLCAAVAWAVDPCFYYRIPERIQPIFFNERYQSAGLAKNTQADTVLMGTSMAANYRGSQIAETFGGTAVRITIPDGYYSEFDQVMEALFQAQTPQRIVFALDLNTLVRDESGLTGIMPDYLYNRNPLDDVNYLLNKDVLYYSAYSLKANSWGQGQTLDEGFTWDKDIWWNHETALAYYERPELAEHAAPADAFLANVDSNLQVVEQWITTHPDTDFHFFLSPYSILYWDKTIRMGQLDAAFAALETVCQRLNAYDNVQLYGFLMDAELVENLDYYCDYVHHSGEVCQMVLERIANGEGLLTGENYREILALWRQFVVNYDYEKFWDASFWQDWNETHG